MYDPNKVTYFAETNARNKKARFGIKTKDRSRHVYVIGKTGTGKSTMIENMAIQDIHNGNGLCYMDPHGMTADKLLEYIPEERINDVLYIAPFDLDNPVSFNIMEDVGYDKRHLVVGGLMSSFKKIWQDAWSARMEYILSNTLFALLEYPGATLLSVNKMLSDKEYRKKVVANIQDPSIKSYWEDEFAGYTERFAAEATPAIQNKVGQFTSNPLVRNIIGQPKSSFDLRKLMDEKKIVIVNLSKGRIGEANANLLGSLLVTKIYLSAMSRADLAESELDQLPDFYLYVDEFQSFANESFADILSEARKYKLNLTIAHQYIEQMPEEVREAVFGNVGTMVTFRVGAYDAEVLEKEFAPTFTAEDIVNLGFTEIYLRLMIDGMGSKPFSAKTILPSVEKSNLSKEVIEASRKQYSFSREEVEKVVKELIGTVDNKNNNKKQNSNNNQQKNNKNNFGNNNKNGNNNSQNHKKKDHSNNREGDFRKNKKNESKPLDEEKKKQIKEEFEKMKSRMVNNEKNTQIEDKPIEEETVSLKDLERSKKTQKAPTTENTNALKDALAKAMAESKKSENNKTKDNNQNDGENKNNDKTISNQAIDGPNPDGLSEDQLKKILEM